MVCSTPVLGHAIAIGVAASGNKELAKDIFIDATKTTAIVTAVAAASVVAGPGGAVIAVKAATAAKVTGAAAAVYVAATATGRTANFSPTQHVPKGHQTGSTSGNNPNGNKLCFLI